MAKSATTSPSVPTLASSVSSPELVASASSPATALQTVPTSRRRHVRYASRKVSLIALLQYIVAPLLIPSGHVASDCSVNRMFANFAALGITEMSAEDAWKVMEQADKEKDVDDIKKVRLTSMLTCFD